MDFRGWQDTIECLESVYRQHYPAFRVVVCNNEPGGDALQQIDSWARGEGSAVRGEGDGGVSAATSRYVIRTVTIDRASAEGVEEVAGGDPADLVLIEAGDNLGFAGGNNVGIRFALSQPGASYIWLLNNDTIVDPDALRLMVDLAESRPEVGMVGSKLLDYERRDVIQAAAGGGMSRWRGLTRHHGEGEADRGQWDRIFEPDCITGASLLVKEATIREIGLLDERYFLYSEEVDWCIRARRYGWKLLYSPGSRVWHKGGKSVGYSSVLHDYYTVRSMLLLTQKFYPIFLPFTLAYTVYRCLAPKVIRRQPARLRAVIQAYRDFFRMVRGEGKMRQPPRPTFLQFG